MRRRPTATTAVTAKAVASKAPRSVWSDERDVTRPAPVSGNLPTVGVGLLTQLVSILVSNALAHTPISAPVTLGVALDGSEAVITVVDRGPGLDSGAASRVFDRFWRGQASRARSKGLGRGGAGLGLSIARSITDAHGGTISLDTAPGEGCTFTVRLPLEQTS